MCSACATEAAKALGSRKRRLAHKAARSLTAAQAVALVAQQGAGGVGVLRGSTASRATRLANTHAAQREELRCDETSASDLADLAAVLAVGPGALVEDPACGTGAIARELRQCWPGVTWRSNDANVKWAADTHLDWTTAAVQRGLPSPRPHAVVVSPPWSLLDNCWATTVHARRGRVAPAAPRTTAALAEHSTTAVKTDRMAPEGRVRKWGEPQPNC